MLALYNLCAWIFPINFCIFEAWNIFCDTEIHVNFSRCIGLWQEKKCEKVSGPKIKIGYTWQEKNWNWSRCNFSNFFKRSIFSRDSRTLLILFSLIFRTTLSDCLQLRTAINCVRKGMRKHCFVFFFSRCAVINWTIV